MEMEKGAGMQLAHLVRRVLAWVKEKSELQWGVAIGSSIEILVVEASEMCMVKVCEVKRAYTLALLTFTARKEELQRQICFYLRM